MAVADPSGYMAWVADQIVALPSPTSATAHEVASDLHLVRIVVGGLHHTRGGREALVDVAGIHQSESRLGCGSARTRAGHWKATAAIGPRRAQRRRRLHGLPGFLRDHADEVLANDDADKARTIPHGRLVDATQCRVHARRPDDGAVQHAVDAYVVHVLNRPVAIAGGRGVGRTCDTSSSREIACRVGIEREVESPATDQVRIVDASCRCLAGNRAIAGRQPMAGSPSRADASRIRPSRAVAAASARSPLLKLA